MSFRLRTFGGLSLTSDSGPVTGAAAQRRKLALLAVLATSGERGVSRDRLLTLFWSESDAEHARHALNQSLSAVRRDLHNEDIILGSSDLRLNSSLVESDVATFETALARGELARAAALYTGPFLDAVHLDQAHESPEFDHWVEVERARLGGLAINALERLAADAAAQGEHRRAVECWRRLAALDPYDERFASGLVTSLLAAGDRTAALRQAQLYETLVRNELGIEPDGAVLALVHRFQRRTEAPPARAPAVDRAETVAATSDTPSRASRSLPLAFGLAVAAVAGAALIARSFVGPALDANLVAVAPFDVLDRRLDLWHEGLVDYLSRNLDRAGPLRTVSPTVVLRRWEGSADPTSARDLARRTGAHLVVFGQVVSAGANAARVRLTLLDAGTGHVLVELEQTDVADRIDRLADSLTTRLLNALGRIRSETHLPPAPVNTTSLPALKAFLRGEQLLRRFSLDSAIAAYEEAVVGDSTFAVALHHLGVARAWRGQSGGPLGHNAGRFNHGLAPRDSLLIVSDSLEAASDDPRDGAYWSHRARKLSTLEEASRRYPDDPEVWYELGEARFHLGYVVGSTTRQTLDAFNRAIALDSAFAPAYIHPVQLALDWNDTAAASRYITGYVGLTSDVPEGAGIRLVGQLIDPRGEKSSARRASADTVSANVLFDAWRSVQRLPDADETSVRLLQILASGRRGVGLSSDTSATRYLLATELLYRGHLRAARSMIGSRLSVPYGELAALGIVPADSAILTFDQWLHSPNERATIADPPWVTRCYRSFLAAGWWARRQDTLALLSLMRRGDAIARLGGGVVRVVDARADATLARAALALARRDTAEALRQFVIFPDSLCGGLSSSLAPSLAPLHLMRFELLAATGRDREAALLFDQQVTAPLTTGSVMATLERGRVAERLGDRVTAVRMYRFVVSVWGNADPELRVPVEEARVALTRLTGEPR
jgi:DNA-binding SARP family transcriptional activator